MKSKCLPHKFLTAIIIGTVALVANAAPSVAQTTWDGGGDGQNWSDPGNWDPDGVPTSTTDVLLDSGITVQLDVAAETADLTLDQATVEGPADLQVNGHLHWTGGTVAGDGVLTVLGGLTWAAGADKVVGRRVEVQSDASFEHSTIFYDVENGGSVHYHAGTTLTIVHDHSIGGDASEGDSAAHQRTLYSGRRLRAAHLEAPLSGEDPTADQTDVYVVEFDGQVVSNTTVFRDVSAQVNGTYQQDSGSQLYSSGSRFTPQSTYILGVDAEILFGPGTHLMQGPLTESQAGTALGARTLGNQTVFRLDPGFSAMIPFRTSGLLELTTDVNIQRLTVESGQPTEICGDATLTTDEFGLEAFTTLQQTTLRTALANIFSANITLTQGATIDADEMVIDQDQSGLIIDDDADPQDLEDIRIRERLRVLRTGTPPLRIRTDLDLEEGSETTIGEDTEVQFFGDVSIAGTVEMENGATWTTRDGRTFINANGLIFEILDQLNGPSTPGALFAIDIDGTVSAVDLGSHQLRDVDVRLKGTLEATGTNDFGNSPLRVEGGTIEGTGAEIKAKVHFDPESSIERAEIDQATVVAKDGSTWNNGHIDLRNGAKLKVEAGAELTSSQAASGLSINDDADPGQEERVEVEGRFTVDQTTGTGLIMDCPGQVFGTLTGLPNTKTTIRDPLDIFGCLQIEQNAEFRFIFTNSTLQPDGKLSGDGAIVEAVNGELQVMGTIEVGAGKWLDWTGDLDTSVARSPTFSVPPVDFDQPAIQVSGTCALPPTVVMSYSEQQDPGEVTFNLIAASSFIGSNPQVEVDGSFTDVQISQEAPFLTATAVTEPNASLLAGAVFVDLDQDGCLFPEDQPIPDVTIRLEDEVANVIATTVTDEQGDYSFQGDFSGPLRIVLEDPMIEDVTLVEPVSGFINIDLEPGDGFGLLNFRYHRDARLLTVNSTADSGPGTFREAVDEVNMATAGTNDRYFAIDVSAVAGQVLSLLSPLPSITRPIAILGDSPNALTGSDPFALDGSQCSDCDGLVLTGGENVILGITVQDFDGYGIVLEELGDNVILDNDILGNAAGGILIRSGFDNHVGSAGDPKPNLITANGGPGITILDGERHAVRNNQVFGNAGQAIDLLGDGLTLNDARDLDDGPNDLQNTPVVTDQDPLGFTVSGTLESRPVSDYVIEIYGSETCPETGTADLQQLLGVAVVETDADGLVSFTIDTEPFAGELSAIAVAQDGSTSEASPCFSSVVTSAENNVPMDFDLRVGPNPTWGPSYLRFQLPSSQRVEATIHDVGGRRVRDLLSADVEAGWHELVWDGTDDFGRRLARGVYYYRLQTEAHSAGGRIVKIQ